MSGEERARAVRDRQVRRSRVAALAALAIVAALAGVAVGVGLERMSSRVAAVTTTVEAGAGDVSGARGWTLTPAQIAAASAPGVVSILATSVVSGPPLWPGSSEQAVSEGSGFVLDRSGRILTNQHVVGEAAKIHVSFADGTKVHATVLAADPLLDLAVLQVDVPASALHPLAFGSSDSLALGDFVVAIGNPFDLERSVSVGVVSGLHRQMTSPNGFTIWNAVQTDAAINHGNSGGPLLDARGRVVGVNAQIADSGVDANVGVGFAVAIDASVKRAIAALRASRTISHAWLGLTLADIDAILATSGYVKAAEGALIAGVVRGSPAGDARLRGGTEIVTVDGLGYCVGGDIVTEISGTAVTDVERLQSAIAAHEPGDKVTLAVVRSDGSKARISVTLGTQPDEAPQSTTGCE